MNHRSLAFRLAVWYALLLERNIRVGRRRHVLRAGAVPALEPQRFAAAPLGAGRADPAARRSRTCRTPRSPMQIDTRVAPEFNNRFVRVTRAPHALVYRSGAPADRSFDPRTHPACSAAHWPAASVARRDRDRRRADPDQRHAAARPPRGATWSSSVARSSRSNRVQDRLLGLLGILLPVLVACAAGGGYLLVQRALRPVERMSQTAEQISVQNLDARLPVVPTGDALQQLSLSLNHMLDAAARFGADLAPLPRRCLA